MGKGLTSLLGGFFAIPVVFFDFILARKIIVLSLLRVSPIRLAMASINVNLFCNSSLLVPINMVSSA